MTNRRKRLGGEIESLVCDFLGKRRGKKFEGRKGIGRKKEEMRESEG